MKTKVDMQLVLIFFQNNLWEENKIRLFKLTSGSDEFAVVLTDDYINHMKGRTSDTKLLHTIGWYHNCQSNWIKNNNIILLWVLSCCSWCPSVEDLRSQFFSTS